MDPEFTAEEKANFARNRLAARRARWKIWKTFEQATFAADSEMVQGQTALAASYLARKVEDPELRALLTPDFPVGCKRPLISATGTRR